ncbi:uncharacterized protein LOC133191745 [Saccostrea echinata]|uniref:uncharacterized protein LOC133175273 n=1 Tax=Saccostrea echinata TaxID=191078 RepID=UPI002A82C9F2|nr:uncharacterized protein LOC133175273 [Saccostrea echinata]XP_061183465.1 uncharacterized protein LOC133191745 [Saccostrea echinata]
MISIVVVCEDGTYGTNCSEVCQGGYFGRLCKSECPTSCMFTCNKVTGNCNHQAPAETKQRNSEQESVRQGKYTPRRSQKILKRNEVSLMFRDEDSGRNKNLKQLIEISTDIKECTLNSIPDDRNEVHIGNTHLSDRKHKYWYSLAKKFEITDEIDISQEFSDDEDVFDSDNDVEYDSMSVE